MNWLHSLRLRLFGSQNIRGYSNCPPGRKKPSRRLRLEYLEDRLAPSVSMVADLTVYTLSSNPHNLTDVNGTLFFSATTSSGNDELFKSDGTAGGTVQLTSGTRLSFFNNLISLNGKLFFEASDSTLGYNALWTSDGTVAGTVPFLAADNNVEVYASTFPVIAGSKFYFQAFDLANHLNDLWVSDGTSAGTHPVQPGSSSDPTALYDLTNVNGKLFFESYDTSTGNYTLWTSNGTAAGTSIVTELTANQPTNFTALGSKLYFEMYDASHSLYALWKSDGTAAGTALVSDIGTANQSFSIFAPFNNKLYFAVDDLTDAPHTGWALWTSDGTSAGTVLFKFNGNTTAVQTEFVSPSIVFNGALYFEGWDSTNSLSLWKTDGVSSNNNTGTVQASGANPFNGLPNQLTIVNKTELYFVANNSSDAGNNDLWKTDGTSAGTTPVQTSGYGRGLVYLTASGSKLFFQAYDVDANNNWPHGKELWASDGTNAGTAMVTDINTATGNSNPSNLVAVNNEIFFSAVTYIPFGTFLWQSDGTAANTAPVQTSTGTIPALENNWIAVGNTLFFTGYGTNGNDLWTTGTSLNSAVEIFPTGTNPFNGTFDSSNADAFANLNGILYFGAYDAAQAKYALWKSDGTSLGTTVVADLDPTYQLSELRVVGTNLFWQQYDSAHSTYALWEYNGTTASLVSDIAAGGISNLTTVGSNLFFQAYDSAASKYALWTSNGASTTMLGDISGSSLVGLIAFNGKLFFGAYGPTPGYYEMWTSDGTVAGTTPFLNAAGQPVPVSSVPFPAVVGTELFYANYDVLSNRFLLGKTDGTAIGTGTVQGGSNGNITLAQNPSWLVNDNGILVFQALDSAHGYELWQSDGTANGTMLTADIVTGPGSSNPSALKVAGNQVFFNATDLLHGSQLWTATLAATVVTAGLSGPNDGVTEQHRPFVLTASDSNSSNNSAGFSFAINWGDGTSQTVIGQSGMTTDHQYATAGNFVLSVTAKNLADNVTSVAVTQTEAITLTEVQGPNLALGGVAGSDAFIITPGTTSGTFTVKVNGTALITNFRPASGEQIFLYPGNGTTTVAINDSGTSNDAFVLGTGYVTFKGTTFVPQAPASWTINGNSGNDTFTISGAANATITGGSGKNTFKVTTGGNLTGTINGGTGTANTLDYSGYATSGIVVDLPLGSATAINGGANNGISNIQNATGSSHGGDILVGDAHANVLKALKGHNLLIGGLGGGDTLTSGGADILIAGFTNYDTNIAALQTILAEWKTSTPSTYFNVISTIESASFADPLNTSTVIDSAPPDLADTLNGSGKMQTDWFFAHETGGTNPNDALFGVGMADTITEI
jgi:ELWxxDGT repeat protein